MKHYLEKIPSIFKNFYFLGSLFFLVWLALIDSNDLFMQADLSRKHKELKEARQFYQDKILEVKNEKAALESNPDLLEKLAREKYLMKKDNEDLYIVVNQ